MTVAMVWKISRIAKSLLDERSSDGFDKYDYERARAEGDTG